MVGTLRPGEVEVIARHGIDLAKRVRSMWFVFHLAGRANRVGGRTSCAG